MGGKGGSSGGAQATNTAMVQMQQQQAAQAQQANAERNARLAYGKQNITNMFEGTPSGSTPLDFSSITDANAPKTTAGSPPDVMTQWLALNPGTAAPDFNTYGSASLPGGYSWKTMPDDGSGVTTYGLYDNSNNLVNSGSVSDLAATKVYTGGDASKKDEPFGSDFYDKYRNSILDYMMPQEGQQYADARSTLSYALARAGTTDSSAAGTNIAKLANQDVINRANITSNADTQTGALRTTIAGDEQSALNQLYSTEDPSVAANTAQNMVANAQLTTPLLNPAGALFAPIAVGVGNALTGFLNPTAYINPNAGSAATSTGNQSSGVPGTG